MKTMAPNLFPFVLEGRRDAVELFVGAMTPIIQVRVARVLVRGKPDANAKQLRQETEDLCQEAFAALFAEGGRVLRAWSEERGLSLANYVGLVAERLALSYVRTGKKNPWREALTDSEELQRAADKHESHRCDEGFLQGSRSQSPEALTAGRELLTRVVDRLKQSISPLGYQVFYLSYVQQHTIDEICEELGVKPDAVYGWRSKLAKLARALHDEILTDDSRRRRADGLRAAT